MRNIEGTGGQAPRQKRSIWPWVVVGMLGCHVAAMLVAMRIATNDRHFSVVQNYYEKAINWDDEQSKVRESQKLAWQIAIDASPEADVMGRRNVTFTVTDRSGKPIEGSTLAVEYFHYAHPDKTHEVKLATIQPGRFTQALPMRHAGFYEFHFVVTAQGETFVSQQTWELAK
jgi:nitrogen fixation protein FixH